MLPLDYIPRLAGRNLIASAALFCACHLELSAITITAYSDTVNDRFSSGFPLAPIANADGSFIGNGLDFSGVGWSTTIPGGISNNSYKGLGMLSPIHFLTAQHFEYPQVANQDTRGIRIRQQDGTISTANGVSLINNLDFGWYVDNNGNADHDLAVGTLSETVATPNTFSRLAVLDLYDSSSDDSKSNAQAKYNGLSVFLYGRGGSANESPRLAQTTIFNIFDNGGDTDQRALQISQNDAAFVLGDSASPVLNTWENPEGTNELTVLGVNSVYGNIGSTTYNFSSFFARAGAIFAANNAMNSSGYALRCVGDPDYTWAGNSSARIDRNSAWGIGGWRGGTSDRYVLFDPSTAISSNPSIQSNYTLRGLYFKSSTSSDDSFTFSGSSTLTIGRGGVTNYDQDQQVFSANLALSSSQYWALGTGGVQLANLDTNGHLLELDGSASSYISGNITDSGGIAISAGQLTLGGNSSYSGNTWIHGGELIVDGDISSSAELIIDSYGTLSGSGSVPLVSGSGLLAPGSSPGILTSPALSPAAGLDFALEFTAASAPNFGVPNNSINDLIRLTNTTPFTTALDISSTVSIYFNISSIENSQQFRGGFFTDSDTDFLASINGATFKYYIADPSGGASYNGQTYSEYSGIYLFAMSTPSQSANFGGGTTNGKILQIEIEPDQSQYEGWKIFHGLSGNDALDAADTDFDGIGQLLEFAVGGDPNDNNLGILPSLSLVDDGGSTYLELTLDRPIGLQGINYMPKTTTALTTWPNDSNGIANPSPQPSDNGNGTEKLVYRRSQPVSDMDQAFIRVEVSVSP
jgi:autotransporter-associated beta strand protein